MNLANPARAAAQEGEGSPGLKTSSRPSSNRVPAISISPRRTLPRRAETAMRGDFAKALRLLLADALGCSCSKCRGWGTFAEAQIAKLIARRSADDAS